MDLRTVLEPLFRKYAVNVVMGGHDHVYERTVPQHGILYFVMGSSGKLRSGDLNNDSLKAAGFDSTQSFLLMEVAGDELYYQAISRTGETVDSGVFRRPTPEGNGSAPSASGGGGKIGDRNFALALCSVPIDCEAGARHSLL
jgi:hypothetical protein